MSTHIRLAGAADLDAVTDLIAESYAEYEAVFPQDIWAVYRRGMLDIAATVATDHVLVAESAARLDGSVVFFPDGTTDRPAWPAGTASLRLLAVAPHQRGRGTGRILVDECIRRATAAGAHALGLHTAPFMESATHLYTAMGFERAPALDFEAYERFGLSPGPGADAIRGLAYVLALPEAGSRKAPGPC